jgi:hypothetical protein
MGLIGPETDVLAMATSLNQVIQFALELVEDPKRDHAFSWPCASAF